MNTIKAETQCPYCAVTCVLERTPDDTSITCMCGALQITRRRTPEGDELVETTIQAPATEAA